MRPRVFSVVFFVGLALTVAGCGSSKLAEVKGKVTCHGKPVGDAFITFNPVPSSETDREAGKPATGSTDPEGNYTLSTYTAHDGALIGKHEVTVALDDTNPARCLPRPDRLKRVKFEVKPGSNQCDIEIDK
jgi:hypothetical protein